MEDRDLEYLDNIIDYLDEEGLLDEFDWDAYSRWKEKLIECCDKY